MVVLRGVGDAEAQRHEVEERRVGQLQSAGAQIVADVEDQLLLTGHEIQAL